jgi:hypothetical protein
MTCPWCARKMDGSEMHVTTCPAVEYAWALENARPVGSLPHDTWPVTYLRVINAYAAGAAHALKGKA